MSICAFLYPVRKGNKSCRVCAAESQVSWQLSKKEGCSKFCVSVSFFKGNCQSSMCVAAHRILLNYLCCVFCLLLLLLSAFAFLQLPPPPLPMRLGLYKSVSVCSSELLSADTCLSWLLTITPFSALNLSRLLISLSPTTLLFFNVFGANPANR